MSQQPGNDEATILLTANTPASNLSLDEHTLQPTDPFPVASQQTAAYQDNMPRSFGRYRVVSMFGQGGFGAVYRAVDDLRSTTVSSPAGATPVSPLTPNTAELAMRVTDATPTGPTRIVPAYTGSG